MERSFKGISLAQLILALYNGTWARGAGRLHARELTLKDVETWLKTAIKRPRKDRPPQTELQIEFFYGKPLRVTIDLVRETFDDTLYNADAGFNKATAALRRAMPVVNIKVDQTSDAWWIDDDGGKFKRDCVTSREDAEAQVEQREDFYRAELCRNSSVQWK